MSNAAGLSIPRRMLGEGAILETLRRSAGVDLDPEIANAGLLYSDNGRAAMREIVAQYLNLACEADVPFMITTPTWRAQPDRIARSRYHGKAVNADAVRFAKEIGASASVPVQVVGLMGPRGDCYRPEEAPDSQEAKDYHYWQAKELAAAGVDWIMAATLPSLEEARGIVSLAPVIGTPIVPSFVLDPSGRLLDGHTLPQALETIGGPLMLNCTHWSFARIALTDVQAAELDLILGLQANTAACHPGELDGAPDLLTEAPEVFAGGMIALSLDYGLRILGGCCGTGLGHLAALAQRLKGP